MFYAINIPKFFDQKTQVITCQHCKTEYSVFNCAEHFRAYHLLKNTGKCQNCK